jgi:hypothetical protein
MDEHRERIVSTRNSLYIHDFHKAWGNTVAWIIPFPTRYAFIPEFASVTDA